MNKEEKVKKLKEEIIEKLKEVTTLKELNDLKIEYLSKKGPISELSSLMKEIPNEEKKEFGSLLNDLKTFVNNSFDELKEKLEEEALNKKLEEEKNNHFEVKEDDSVEVDGKVLDSKKILVLCAGGGTSGLLANALAKGAKEEGIPLVTAAGSYGAHLDIMGDYDLVILAPQVASYYEDLKKDADRMGVKCIACEGKQYIDLTRNPKGALEFVFKIMGE